MPEYFFMDCMAWLITCLGILALAYPIWAWQSRIEKRSIERREQDEF